MMRSMLKAGTVFGVVYAIGLTVLIGLNGWAWSALWPAAGLMAVLVGLIGMLYLASKQV